MSSIKVNQIKARLTGLFEEHLDLTDISATDPERDIKILSRCVAAFAIYHLTACSPIEAAQSVWDGSDDNGIDAAYFDASEGRVIFVQSKWIQKGSGEPEAKDIGSFTRGVKDALESNRTMFHARLDSRLDAIIDRLVTPGTKVHLALVSTGSSTIAQHGTQVLETFIDDLNGDDPDEMASSEILGLQEIFSGLVNDPSVTNLSIDATLYDWAYVSSPYPAYFGLIDGLQIKQWWTKYGKRIVAANLRQSLGGTDVNNEIRQTASSSPGKFWYFNNGITLVAEEAIKAPANASSKSAGVFVFRGASIVNGAQTASSLEKVLSDASLSDVRVSIRVVLLKSSPAGFGDEVTRTNNLQNKIEPRDFAAQDPQQRRLKDEMAIEGVEYQYLRSEDATQSTTSCELVEVTTALACAAGDSGLAVQAKTGVSSRFFSDLTKAPYKSIFNPSTTGARAFNATLVLREIDRWIEKKKASVKKSGPPWGMLVHGNRILAAAVITKYGKAKLDQSIATFQTALISSDINQICVDVHLKMIGAFSTHYSGKWPATIFKSPVMSKRIYDDAVK